MPLSEAQCTHMEPFRARICIASTRQVAIETDALLVGGGSRATQHTNAMRHPAAGFLFTFTVAFAFALAALGGSPIVGTTFILCHLGCRVTLTLMGAFALLLWLEL